MACLSWSFSDLFKSDFPADLRAKRLRNMAIADFMSVAREAVPLLAPEKPPPPPRGLEAAFGWARDKMLAASDYTGVRFLANKLLAPEHVARADPAFAAVKDATTLTVQRQNSLLQQFRERTADLKEGLLPQDEVPLARLFDKYANSPETGSMLAEAAAISPQAGRIAARMKAEMDLRWQEYRTAGIAHADEPPILNYLPKIRGSVVTKQELAIEGGPVNTTMRLERLKPVIAPDGTEMLAIPDDVQRLIPTAARPFFLRGRGSIPDQVGMSFSERLDILDQVAARALAHADYTKAVVSPLNAVSDRFKPYAINFVNKALGAPGAAGQMDSDAVNFIRELQGARVLSGIVTAAVNKTQIFNPLMLGWSLKNILKGAFLGPTPELQALAKMAGLPVGQPMAGPFSAEIGATMARNRTPDGTIPGWLEPVRRWIRGESESPLWRVLQPTSLFGATEAGKFGNIPSTFAAGLYEAADRGMVGRDAIRFALLGNEKTQFTTGIGRTPEAMRSGMGSILGQFKQFAANQYELTMGAFTSGDPKRMLGAAKWLVMGATLFGPDFMWPDLEETVTKHVFGEATRTPGLIPYFGAAIAERVGIGMDANDIRRMMAFLPGPTVANLADAATAMDYLLRGQNGVDYSKLLSFDYPGATTEGITPEVAARSMTRMLPIAGVPLDRVRRMVKSIQSGGESREVLDLKEAFGLTEPSPSARVLGEPLDGIERLLVGLGLTPDKVIQEFSAVREERAIENAKRLATRQARKLLLAGKASEALDVADAFFSQHGEALNFTAAPTREEQLAQALPPTERHGLLRGVAKSPELSEALRPKRSLLDLLSKP